MEDGSSYSGTGFGFQSDVTGEVVFNTGMVGYTETLTDPSYSGQIICLTYPLIGNYGVPSFNIKDRFGLPKYFESRKIQVKGLIIHNLSEVASHWECIKTLDTWLHEERIPGIYGIDTRELTKKLRVNGVMMGKLSVSENKMADDRKFLETLNSASYEGINFMPEVSVEESEQYGDKNKDCIVLIDTGTKYSIIRNLIKSGFRVVVLPWNVSYEKVMSYKPKGIVISNGPGDPKVCKNTIATASKLISSSVPTLGICLGNQILALAAGADTYKLKFGHRGQNKTAIDTSDNRAYITSQNHGYGVKADSLQNTGFKVWFSNPDDQSVEGIEHITKPIIAVQFHPEASPGPYDCMFVFDRFKNMIMRSKRHVRSSEGDSARISKKDSRHSNVKNITRVKKSNRRINAKE